MSIENDEKDLDDQLPDPQLQQLIRTKGKCKTYSRQKEILVELKPKRRPGKCLGAAHLPMAASMTEHKEPESYIHVPNEIWLLVAEHIPPELVRSFALICREASHIVRTRSFWMHLYRRYCLPSAQNSWQYVLREQQRHDWQNCDWRSLRAHVIEKLFLFYEPFVARLKNVDYPLDTLLGCTYVASWATEATCGCGGVIVHKFYKGNVRPKHKINETELPPAVEDWESLADENSANCVLQSTDFGTGYAFEGFYLLVLLCNKYVPCPMDIRYESGGLPAKMIATREKLLSDMHMKDLELDFADPVSRAVITWTYPKINNSKVMPWWHPKFHNFMCSYES